MISAANPYAAYSGLGTYRASTSSLASQTASDGASTQDDGGASSDAAIVSLSAAARAALAKASGSESLFSVTSRARDTLDQLLKSAGLTSPLKDGKVAIDLSGLDRRALFAIASNAGNGFSEDEQAAARSELTDRFDTALQGPAAVARVTGDKTAIYKAAQSFLDAAGTEERASDAWGAARSAVSTALSRLKVNPDADLSDIANDPVADYLADPTTGQGKSQRDFGAVAADARSYLDEQAKARAKLPIRGAGPDMSELDSRSLAAVALNQGGQFSQEETRAAKEESRSRVAQQLIASMQSSGDPRALSVGIISQYASMSAEERQALGWTEDFQTTAIENYRSTSNVLSILNGALNGGGGGMSGGLASFL